MSKVQETLAEIEEELRSGEYAPLADRIEAAAKREVERLNSVIQAQRSAFDAEQDRQRRAAPGNSAALREALEKIYAIAKTLMAATQMRSVTDSVRIDVGEIRYLARAALAKPPRNCDRFADELDAQIAFLNEVWLISVTKESMLERDKFENWTDEMKSRYAAWLFAPATEKEGGAE